MSKPIILYDACVLYPAPLRDILMHLALTGLFQAKWTDQIHEEWIKNVLKNRPDLTKKQLNRTRNLMNLHARDALIAGYEHLIPKLSLPDMNDCHVLAAAIHGSVSKILTYNIKDFPEKALKPYRISVQHPDEFLFSLLTHESDTVCNALKRLRLGLKNPPLSVTEYLLVLTTQGLSKTASELNRLKCL